MLYGRRWFAAYAQDTFRVTDHITINFGVRWEPSTPPYDHYDRGDQFSLAAFNAGIHSTVYPNAPAGLLFAGDKLNTNGKQFMQSHLLTTSPRIGVVWDPRGDGKQTVRAAFGLMHDTTELFFPERLTTNPPYASSVTINNTSFSNPYLGYPGGNPFPGAAIFPVGGTYVDIPPNMRPTYMMQWNVSYQRQLGSDWLATVNYLGNKTTHIWGSYDINPAVYIPGSTASTNQRRLLYLPTRRRASITAPSSRRTMAATRTTTGCCLPSSTGSRTTSPSLANYTWSHCISDVDFTGELAGTIYQNPNNRAAERGSCGFDHRHIVNTSMLISSPGFGNAFAKQLTGGWQLAPIFTASSGAPITLTDGGKDVSMTGQLQDRPNVVLPDQVYPATRTVAQWFNPAAFAIQPTGTFGNLGRFSLNGPGSWNLDLSLSRRFRLKERYTFEFRGEAFNFFNHANWNAPTVSISSAQFGQITTFSSPRIIQLGAKFLF